MQAHDDVQDRPRIGIDLGGTKIQGIVLERDDTLSASIRIGTPRDDYQGTLDAIGALVRELEGSESFPVGVGTPGTWLAGPGVMQNCNSTWLNGRPLFEDLTQSLGQRVRLANDADCFTLSEALSGSAKDADVVFGVILGTGVGGGIVAGGRLLSGPNGLAGEWGHTPMLLGSAQGIETAQRAPRACYCGQLDCVETYLSGPGLLGTHRELWPGEVEPPSDAADVYRRAALASAPTGWAEGAPSNEGAVSNGSAMARARSTLGVYCRMLARSLAQIVNVVDPHAIVLGGGLSQMGEIYGPVRTMMADHVFGGICETRLLPPRWGDASGVRGAAWLWD